jgi:membrane dipeptidase
MGSVREAAIVPFQNERIDLKNVERLFTAGYRTSELCHFTDTPFAAAASGVSEGGLTSLGREAVALMNELGMIVDLAHAAPRVIEEVLVCSKGPPFISHTGARSIHDDPKCQSDELLRAIVDKGGVVGLCFVEDYIGGTRLDDIRRCLEHLLSIVGQDGIVLGSGFDSLPVPISVDQLPYLTHVVIHRARRGSDQGHYGRECNPIPPARAAASIPDLTWSDTVRSISARSEQ